MQMVPEVHHFCLRDDKVLWRVYNMFSIRIQLSTNLHKLTLNYQTVLSLLLVTKQEDIH